MKIVGHSLLAGSLLAFALLWLVPFGPGNPYYRVQHCVPIREVVQYRPVFAASLDLCHERSIIRVTLGAVTGVALAALGTGVLIAYDRRRLAGWSALDLDE